MTREMTLVSIGELLWDVFDDCELLGGAPFNFSVHAVRLGHQVGFVSAVGQDERGRAAMASAAELGLPCAFLQIAPDAPTGAVTVRLDSAGQPAFTIHRPAAYDSIRLESDDLARIARSRPDWIYFGTLLQTSSNGREAVRRLIESNPGARRFYDINLRPDCYSAALVKELMRLAHVVKLNEDEAMAVNRMFGEPPCSVERFSRLWSERFGWQAVSVTRGAEGCAVLVDGDYAEAGGYPVTARDTVGAGDAFAAAFVHGLGQGWDARAIGDFANRVAAIVATRPGGAPPWTIQECEKLIR